MTDFTLYDHLLPSNMIVLDIVSFFRKAPRDFAFVEFELAEGEKILLSMLSLWLVIIVTDYKGSCSSFGVGFWGLMLMLPDEETLFEGKLPS